VVIAVIAGLNALHRGGGRGDPAVRTASATALTSTEASGSASPSGPPSTDVPFGGGGGAATTSATATTNATPATSALPPPTPTAPPRAILVVYNSTGVRALAGRAAMRLTGGGYAVRSTGDIAADVGVTTAYYDPPQAAAAQALVAARLGVVRALARPRFLLPTGTVIVVLASDYAHQ